MFRSKRVWIGRTCLIPRRLSCASSSRSIVSQSTESAGEVETE